MKTLRECLVDYDTTLLRAIAERDGVELTTSHHREMVEEIAVGLLDPAALVEVVAWLSDEERRSLGVLVSNGGRVRAHRFRQQFGDIRRFGPGRMAREAPWRAPTSSVEGLWYRGLISRAFAEEAGVFIEFVFVPDDLMPLLPPLYTEPRAFQVPSLDLPARAVLGDLALIDDLCSLLAMVRDHRVRVRKDQLVMESLDGLREQLLGVDGARLAFLYHLARTCEFVRAEGPTLHFNRDTARKWLEMSRTEQIRALQETWRSDAGWNDLWHVPGIRCEDTGWRNDPLVAREVLLDLLARCSPDAWLSIEGFVSAVRERFPDYARPNGDFQSWYIRDVRSGEYLTGLEHWEQVDGALLVYMLSGPLHWLGVVSLGYREGWERPSAFRLTPWGAAFLDLYHAPIQDLPPQPARVSPDGKVTMARETSLLDRFQLSRVADWRESGQEYVYAITPKSLGRALSAKIEVDRIERFLQRISDDGVPAAAVGRLRSWAQLFGYVRLSRAAILETRTPQLMNGLRDHERIRGYLRQPLSPTTALVRENDWDALIQELERAGYLPKIEQH